MNPASAHTGNEGVRDKLAERFDLDPEEVQAFFEENRQQRHAEHEAERQEAIESAVSEGLITQEQADLLATKQAELQQAREALRDQDLDRNEMRDAMEQLHQDFKSWAEENNIDLEALRPEGENHERRGFKGGRFHLDHESEVDQET